MTLQQMEYIVALDKYRSRSMRRDTAYPQCDDSKAGRGT